jgi:hypothetical protein
MTFRDAKKLHNGDEVTVKKTGEVVTVIDAYVVTKFGKDKVFIECCTADNGFTKLWHTEVK